jgi:hypothetical protein
MLCECGQMRIQFVRIAIDGVRLSAVALQIEAVPIPGGIMVDHVAKLIDKQVRRPRTSGHPAPAQFSTRLERWE